jgi:4-diphosphocytidyl-2-C-methyl-D-erythritol kinase
LYNSLEAPALEKFPILRLFQEFLREHGAWGALMSGSGSTTFALFDSLAAAEAAVGPCRERFGAAGWLQTVAL